MLELKVGERFAYMHFVGKHPEYGDAVLINSQLGARQKSIFAEYFANGYIAFYPVTAAVAQGLIEVDGYLPPQKLPERLRRAGARSGRHVKTWIIESGTEEVVKNKLSNEERRLPIAAIWNHELLVQRISEGWDPMQEGEGNE